MFFVHTFLDELKPHLEDDAVDCLNYFYTPTILVIISLTLSAKQYVGEPIQCWVPAQFQPAMEEYCEYYCFVKNTYFVPNHEALPPGNDEREAREIGYYQWVPFILGVMGVFFYLPALLWRILNAHSGLAIKSVVRMAKQAAATPAAGPRRDTLDALAKHFHDSLHKSRQLNDYSRFRVFHNGRYLTALYLVIKLIYVVQAACQFVVLNRFLATSSSLWGVGILRDLIEGREWEESGHFPRVTMCDFKIRMALNETVQHTVQCVIMINMFNEKVFLFLWWWLLATLVATFISLVHWTAVMLAPSFRVRFIARFIFAPGPRLNCDDVTLRRFVSTVLRPDGVFLCRLVAANAGDLVAIELVDGLWRRFEADEREKEEEEKDKHSETHCGSDV